MADEHAPETPTPAAGREDDPLSPEKTVNRTRFPGTSVAGIAREWSVRWNVQFRQGTSRYAVRPDPVTKREQRMYITPAARSAHDLRLGDEVAEMRCVVTSRGGIDAYVLSYLKECLGSAVSGAARDELVRYLDQYAASKPKVFTDEMHTFPTMWLTVHVMKDVVEASILARGEN